MSNDLIVGFSGNITRPSSTRRFVESVTDSLAKQAGLQHTVFDVEDLGTSLAAARSVGDLEPAARKAIQTIIEAEALVIGIGEYDVVGNAFNKQTRPLVCGDRTISIQSGTKAGGQAIFPVSLWAR